MIGISGIEVEWAIANRRIPVAQVLEHLAAICPGAVRFAGKWCVPAIFVPVTWHGRQVWLKACCDMPHVTMGNTVFELSTPEFEGVGAAIFLHEALVPLLLRLQRDLGIRFVGPAPGRRLGFQVSALSRLHRLSDAQRLTHRLGPLWLSAWLSMPAGGLGSAGYVSCPRLAAVTNAWFAVDSLMEPGEVAVVPTKDQGQYGGRCHISIDYLSSPYAAAFQSGLLTLSVAAAEAEPPRWQFPDSRPLEWFHRLVDDGAAPLRQDGRVTKPLSARDIQRLYLDWLQAFVDRRKVTWAQPVLNLWDRILAWFENHPQSAIDELPVELAVYSDMALKFPLISRAFLEAGVSFPSPGADRLLAGLFRLASCPEVGPARIEQTMRCPIGPQLEQRLGADQPSWRASSIREMKRSWPALRRVLMLELTWHGPSGLCDQLLREVGPPPGLLGEEARPAPRALARDDLLSAGGVSVATWDTLVDERGAISCCPLPTDDGFLPLGPRRMTAGAALARSRPGFR